MGEEGRRSEAGSQGGGEGRGSTPRWEGRDQQELDAAITEGSARSNRMAGTQGWVESPAVEKNRWRGVAGSRTTGEGVVFGLTGSLSNFFSLHVGLKGGFVR